MPNEVHQAASHRAWILKVHQLMISNQRGLHPSLKLFVVVRVGLYPSRFSL